MSDLTRRRFVKNSAGAVAGATVIGALLAGEAEADAGSEPIVAYISNPRKGEISVMRGDREVTVKNRKLAAEIARAGR